MSSTVSYPQAIRTGVFAGVHSITQIACHPVDQIIKPMAKFTTDFAAMVIPFSSSARIATRERLGESLNNVTTSFIQAEGPERAQMAAKVATGLFLSAVGLRAGARVARSFPFFSSPPVQKEVRLITASGDRGTLAYSHRIRNNGIFYAYVDRVQADGWVTGNGSIMGKQTTTSGLTHQALSVLKQQATTQGAHTLHIETNLANNTKLARLAKQRYGRNLSMDEYGIANIKIPLRGNLANTRGY